MFVVMLLTYGYHPHIAITLLSYITRVEYISNFTTPIWKWLVYLVRHSEQFLVPSPA